MSDDAEVTPKPGSTISRTELEPGPRCLALWEAIRYESDPYVVVAELARADKEHWNAVRDLLYHFRHGHLP